MRVMNGLNGHWSFPLQHAAGNTGPASWILPGTWIYENSDYMNICAASTGSAYQAPLERR